MNNNTTAQETMQHSNVSNMQNGLTPLLPYPQWIAWKGTPLANGKTKKLLINPHTGRAASSTDSSTWGTFEQVQEFIAGSEYGVGFVFTKDDPFFFIDVDNKHPHNDEWCQTLRLSFPDAFIETSQSGNGIHIIGIGKKPDGFRCKTDHDWDIYVSGRFCALTGLDTSGNAGAYDHTTVLTSLTNEYLSKATSNVEWSLEAPEDYTSTLSDEELIAKALKGESTRARFGGSASFKDVWIRDNDALLQHFPSDQNPNEVDESRVESAACTHLAFWTGRNAVRIERIMTDLYPSVREKWLERAKYREDTILKAISLTTEYYSKRNETVTAMIQHADSGFQIPTVTDSAPNWLKGIKPGGEYSKDHSVSASTFLTDWYNQGDQLIRIDETFYRYNGKTWEQVDKETLTGEITKAMLACSPQTAWIDGAYKMVQYMSIKSPKLWGTWKDRDTTGCIVYQNGILDLNTNEFLPHDPSFFTTNILPYDYNELAQCPTWDAFVNDIFDGDAQRINLLHEWLGYMLVRDYRFQKAMVMIGQRRSGKGTIGAILKQLVGSENYTGMGLEDLQSDPNMDSLITKTVAFDGDFHGISKFNTLSLTRFKKITGNDEVNFTRKFKGSMSCILPTRFTVAMNNSKLGMIDDSGALLGRFLILAFNKSWFGKEDKELGTKLTAEIQGIANRAIQGLKRLNAAGDFTESEAGQREMERFKGTSQPLTLFVDDKLIITEDAKDMISSDAVWKAWQVWADDCGYSKGTKVGLFEKLQDTYRGKVDKTRGKLTKGSNSVAVLSGLKWNVETPVVTTAPNIIPAPLPPKAGQPQFEMPVHQVINN